MSDSIERLFPTPHAGSSMPGKPPAVADDEQATATRGVKPIDPLMLHRIMDRKPQPYAANDRAYREAERRASGGFWGLLIMVNVVFWIAVAMAIGRAF